MSDDLKILQQILNKLDVLDEIKDKVSSLDTRVGKIEKDINDLKSDVKELRVDVKNIKENQKDIVDFLKIGFDNVSEVDKKIDKIVDQNKLKI